MNNDTYFADVIVPLGVPNLYTYRIPRDWNTEAKIGIRVLVQFGKSRIYTAVIARIHQQAPTVYQAKYLEGILDEEPIINNIQLKFWEWLAYYYTSNPGDIMNAALPSGLKLSSTSHVQLNSEFSFEESESGFFTSAEEKIIDVLHHQSSVSIADLCKLLKVKGLSHQINQLMKKKAVVVYEEVKDKYKPKLATYLTLNSEYTNEEKLRGLLNQLEKKAFKQAEALLAALHLWKTQANGVEIDKSVLSKKADAAAIAALIKKGVFVAQIKQVDRVKLEQGSNTIKELSEAQKLALGQAQEAIANNKIALLMGVTGSGKTELYIQLIKETIEKGRQVLYLVPEIALTTQLITRLRAAFGKKVGVYHSRFSENERVEIWNAIQNSNNRSSLSVILAARSGLFLPFNNLGLVVVDEEHDFSFKQQAPSPRYHARDAAIYLASLHQAAVVLGTATPSLESYKNAINGKYKLVELKSQFTDTGKTEIEICDLNYYEKSQQMKSVLSPPLFNAVQEALRQKKQVILFQNRRGFAPYIQCAVCAHVPYCSHCDVPLIYHKYIHKLKCHYCGYQTDSPSTCLACGVSDLRFKGLGTEKIEEEIELLFPGAKLARLDLDTTRSKYAYKQIIDDFESRSTDILIGTQMVTKGLDFENVSVVGVINADNFLNFPDFRSYERAYQLITQLKGRAGRKSSQGKIFIQTAQKDHQVLHHIMQQDIQAFYQSQLKEREKYQYPPFTRLIQINLLSKNVEEVNFLAKEFHKLLYPQFQNRLLGPESPMISRIKDQYYMRLLIKLEKNYPAKQTRTFLLTSINNLHAHYKKWKFTVQIDVDPY